MLKTKGGKAARQRMALGAKVVAMLRAREAGKAGYAKSDELLEEIVQELQAGKGKAEIKLKDGTTAVLVDNFAKGGKVWKPCGIARWDIKVTRAGDVAAKL